MKKKASITCCALAAALALACTACKFNISLSAPLDEQNEGLSAHYLSVGQGDSIFIELPDSKTMLIDAGESGVGEGIEEYIERLGYDKIDYLVATHPHADHIGSMDYIVESFDIGEIYMPKVSTDTKTYERLLSAIDNEGYTVKSAEAGMKISEENYEIDILAPSTIDEDDLNNCSAVLKITYGDTDFLFTGDAEKKELNAIEGDIGCTVLKTGHHGSQTSISSELMERFSPEYAVISVGADNDYGHPSDKTLELLYDKGCRVYRTDTDGTVTVVSDGENIEVTCDNTLIKGAK